MLFLTSTNSIKALDANITTSRIKLKRTCKSVFIMSLLRSYKLDNSFRFVRDFSHSQQFIVHISHYNYCQLPTHFYCRLKQTHHHLSITRQQAKQQLLHRASFRIVYSGVQLIPQSRLIYGLTEKNLQVCLDAWHNGRTSVFGRQTFPVLRSTSCGRVTTYVGKPSAISQLTRPTQPFITSGVDR